MSGWYANVVMQNLTFYKLPVFNQKKTVWWKKIHLQMMAWYLAENDGCIRCPLVPRRLRESLSGSSPCYRSWWRPTTVPTWAWSHACSTRSRGRRRSTMTQVTNRPSIDQRVEIQLRNMYWLKPFPSTEPNQPPQLPPRNFPVNDVKDSEQASKSLSDTYLARLQHMDLSMFVKTIRIIVLFSVTTPTYSVIV